MRYITERGKGGILYPDDIDENTKNMVQSVLESKHPDARTPGVNAMTDYLFLPDFMDLDITEDSIEVTAWRLSGGAGLWGYGCPRAPAMAAALRAIQLAPSTSHDQPC
jgi:hypothetical protein